MIRNAERPRVAALLAVAAVLAVLALVAGGVIAGRASVEDDGPTIAELNRAATATAAAKRELQTVKRDLGRGNGSVNVCAAPSRGKQRNR